MRASIPLSLLALLLACGGGGSPSDVPAPSSTGSTGPTGPVDPGAPTGAGSGGSSGATGPSGATGGAGWTVVHEERFEGPGPTGAFSPDPVPDDGPFADAGAYWKARGVVPPAAFRATAPYGDGAWLTFESYTRRTGEDLSHFAQVVPDPADPANHALEIVSSQHTDATVVRPSAPLPARYRVSLRVGFPAFGDGKPGLNGYSAQETAGPWWPTTSANTQNGFYWLSILDARPRPHNNTWIHHHRKLVVDSDNHFPPWMQVWDGRRLQWSGERPVTMLAMDGSKPGDEKTGPPFLSYAGGQWGPSGAIRAVDAYLPDTWYHVTIERDGPRYTIEVAGTFEYGGPQTYRATVDAAKACVFHYPVDAAEASGASRCVDTGAFPDTGGEARWPVGGSWPDWFVFGDPHANFYEGHVLYDDLVLEEWRG